ncbi:MAG: vWA domain-containing protein, partial [Candidatus Altiarchaeota archaeon]|nr:vWA domain-containing protein [Candidatus Altiarchaeota archaeon]
DACELRCDGQRECNLFEGCTLFEGNSGQCSNCEDDHLTPDDTDCTHDSKYDADGDPCPGEPHDCYEKICKQDAVVGLFYSFDADLVFIVDTSGSMDGEWKSLCSIMSYVVSELEAGGINVKYDIYGLGSKKSCSTGYIPGDSESWGWGTEDKAKNYPWRPAAKGIIFPVSDEGANYGDPWNSVDDASITAAIAAAKNQDPPVAVFGLYGDGSSDDVISGMKRLSTETGGTAYKFTNKDAVAEAIINAVGTCPDYFTKIYWDMYSRKWSPWEEHKPTPPQPEKRMFCSLEGAVEGVTTFSIPNITIERLESTETECGWYDTCPAGWISELRGEFMGGLWGTCCDPLTTPENMFEYGICNDPSFESLTQCKHYFGDSVTHYEGTVDPACPYINVVRSEGTCPMYDGTVPCWVKCYKKTGPHAYWCCPPLTNLSAEPVVSDEHVWRIEHPAFTLIETGNMPFEVLGPELEISGDEYMIKRVYLPKPTDPHTHQDEFIVKSELVLAYTLLESVGGSVDNPTPFEIIATHSYRSMILRDTYYVACEHKRCQGRCTCCDCSCMDGECPLSGE